jgi:chemotaxis protein MotB
MSNLSALSVCVAALVISPAAMGLPIGARLHSPEIDRPQLQLIAADETLAMPELNLQALQRASDKLTRDLDAQLDALRASAEGRAVNELDAARRELAEAKTQVEALKRQIATVQRELEPKLNVCIADRDAARLSQRDLSHETEVLKAQLSTAEHAANERAELIRRVAAARHDAEGFKAGEQAAARQRNELAQELDRTRTEARRVAAERDAALREKDRVIAELPANRLERDQAVRGVRAGAGARLDLSCVAPLALRADLFAALPLAPAGGAGWSRDGSLAAELAAARNEIQQLRNRLGQAENAGGPEEQLRAELERARRELETERAALKKIKRERDAAAAQARGARAASQSSSGPRPESRAQGTAPRVLLGRDAAAPRSTRLGEPDIQHD